MAPMHWLARFSGSQSAQNRLEAEVGIEPTHRAFAEPCLTTWLLRLSKLLVRSNLRLFHTHLKSAVFVNKDDP